MLTPEKKLGVQATILLQAKQKGHTPQPLDLGQRQGSTDYIDFVRVDDMTSPIMFGIDVCRRPFVSVLLSDKDGKQFVITGFQRYTDSEHPFCVGGMHHWFFFKHNAEDITEKFTRLFAGEEIASVDNEHVIRLGSVRVAAPPAPSPSVADPAPLLST